MKALILAGGKGTRLRPLTYTLPKHLLPVANKPILFYGIEQIIAAGIRDIGIVVSPETGDELKAALADSSRWNARFTFILQTTPLGLAHAVKTAREFLADDVFLLFLGDNLIQDGVAALVDEFEAESPEALIVLKEVADPRAFGVAEIDASGHVTRVVEKPKEPRSNLAVIGAYIFTPFVHQIIDQLQPSWRGEYEITDAIQKILESGKEIRSHVLKGWWLDTGKKEDLLEANQTLLDEYVKRSIRGDVNAGSQISGRVEIFEGSRIENSIIRGPVSIASGCRITNSYIGPYTSIGAGTVIDRSSVDYSVVLDNSRIENIDRLVDSIIGRHVEVRRQKQGKENLRLFVGDYSRLDF